MNAAKPMCETCGQPATCHEVERVGNRRVHRHFCDDHAEGKLRPLPSLMRKKTWDDWLDWLLGAFETRKDWPITIRIPARMVPGPAALCEICGQPATDHEVTLEKTGTILTDRARCVEHGGRPVRMTIVGSATRPNPWPAQCERCTEVATVHTITLVAGQRVPHHFCRKHAAEEDLAAGKVG